MPVNGQVGTAQDGTPVVWVASLNRALPVSQAKNFGVTPAGVPAGGGRGRGGMSTADTKQLANARAASDQAVDLSTKAERFVDLNRKQATGGYMGINFPFHLGGVSETMSVFDPEVGEMQSLTNQMAPTLRAAGSGAMSDKDVELFKRSVPNPDFQGPTNQAIAARLKQDAEKRAAYASFLDTWGGIRGNLQGADAAFLRFWADRQAGGGRRHAPRAPAAAGGQEFETPYGMVTVRAK